MNIRRTGIQIEASGRQLTSGGFNRQQSSRKRYESYVDMQQKLNKSATAIVPFAEHFIKAMEKEGYKISKYSEKEEGENNDASRAAIEETVAAKTH